MLREVRLRRLRASLAEIAASNADLDTAYNPRAKAVAALKEPDLGPPDFVRRGWPATTTEQSLSTSEDEQ